MAVRVYRSTNLNAPVLSGSVGAFIPVMDLLVNGITAMSVTSINRSGSIATVVTASNHGLVTGQLITIAGATESDYNGEYAVTVTGATAFTYTVANSPSTPATGTITAKVAGSGWTKPYTGTNLAMYLQPNTATRQTYLRIDDTGTTSARFRGFETASDVNTGTGPFPTDAQLTSGGYVYKSSAADATARPWVIVCNGPTFYLWINTANVAGAGTTGQMTMFGDFTSYKSGDVYNQLINCATAYALQETVAAVTALVSTAAAGAWIPRSHTQIGTSVTASKHVDGVKTGGVLIMGSGGVGYPSPVDGGLYVSPVFVGESALTAIRGTMNGIWCPCHNRPLANGDIFSGTGALSGKVFEAFHNNTTGQILLEISNTW